MFLQVCDKLEFKLPILTIWGMEKDDWLVFFGVQVIRVTLCTVTGLVGSLMGCVRFVC